MGSYSGLKLGPLSVVESKNEFVWNSSELFQEADLIDSPLYGETEPEEHFERPLRRVLPRLELMGFTLQRAREEYENPNPFSFVDPISLSFEETLDVLRAVDLRSLKVTFPQEPLPDTSVPLEIQQLVRSTRPPGPFEGSHWALSALLENFSPYSTLRVLAECSANLDLPVSWFFDEVVSNGWAERQSITHGLSTHAEYLLVTEGSSDALILRQAFDVLRPDIADFFRFIDMKDGYPFTGTSNLYNFAKGLVSIRITNMVVFIFDNDVEGVSCMEKCNAIPLLRNMKTMKLPDLEELRSFPTSGPAGDMREDINGRGAAIECYLDLPHEAYVKWGGFVGSSTLRQGALVEKEKYKRAFLNQGGRDESYDYSKIQCVLDAIVEVCTSIGRL